MILQGRVDAQHGMGQSEIISASCNGGILVRGRCSRGMTLVEVLIALTLFGLLLASLALSLRGMTDAGEASEHVVQRTDQMRLISDFLRRHLSGVVLIRGDAPGSEGVAWSGLRGTGSDLIWVAPLHAAHAPPDELFLFQLTLSESRTPEQGAGRRLSLMITPFEGTKNVSGESMNGESHLLISQLDELSIRYLSSETGQWQDYWDHPAYLPEAVSINIQAGSRYWPELLVRIQAP